MSNPGEALSGETVNEPTGHQLVLDYARSVHRNEKIRRGDPVVTGQAVMSRVLRLADKEQYAGLDLGMVDPRDGRPLTTEDYLYYMSGEHGDAALLIKQFVDSEGQDKGDLDRVQGFLDDNLRDRLSAEG